MNARFSRRNSSALASVRFRQRDLQETDFSVTIVVFDSDSEVNLICVRLQLNQDSDKVSFILFLLTVAFALPLLFYLFHARVRLKIVQIDTVCFEIVIGLRYRGYHIEN